MFDIQDWMPKIYNLNEKWWRDTKTNEPKERNEGELFCLMASELSEAMEGDRKKLADDKLPQYPMVGVEMVDFVIRIMDYCSRRRIVISDFYQVAEERFPWIKVTEINNRAELIWKMHERLAMAYSSNNKSMHFSFLIADARMFCKHFVLEHSFEEMFEAKFKYNETRIDHTHTARLEENGKEY